MPIVPCSPSLLPQSKVKELLAFSPRTASPNHLLGAGIAWKWWWFTDSGWVIWTDKSLWFNHLLMISSPLAVRHRCPASRECRKQSVQPEKTQGDQPEQCSAASLFLSFFFFFFFTSFRCIGLNYILQPTSNSLKVSKILRTWLYVFVCVFLPLLCFFMFYEYFIYVYDVSLSKLWIRKTLSSQVNVITPNPTCFRATCL